MAEVTVPYQTEEQIKKKYGDWYAAQEKNLNDQATYQTKQANAQYDKAQRNNYVNYRMNQKDLPEMLARQGITGGESETSALRAQTNYENNYNATEGARTSALNDINYNLAQALREYKTQADQNMADEITANLQLQSQYEQGLQEQAKNDFINTLSGYTKTSDVDREIERIKKYGTPDDQYKIEYLMGRRAEIEETDRQLAEAQRQVREERYANTISGWNTIDGINKEIERIRASGVDTWRIPYLRARRAELQAAAEEAAAASSSSGGGYSYRSGGSGGGGSSSNQPSSTPTTKIGGSGVTGLVNYVNTQPKKQTTQPKRKPVTTNNNGTLQSIFRPLTRMTK